MIANGRPCADIRHQLATTNSALRRVGSELLRNHAAHRIDALATVDDKAALRDQLAILIVLFEWQAGVGS